MTIPRTGTSRLEPYSGLRPGAGAGRHIRPRGPVSLTALFLAGICGPAAAGNALSIDQVIDHAKRHAPQVASAEDDAQIARDRVGSSFSTYMPHVFSNNRLTYRYNNPEKYTYTFTYDGSDCTDPQQQGCIPFVIVEDQITAPEDRFSLSTGLTAIQPVLAPKQAVTTLKAIKAHDLSKLEVKGQTEQLVLDLLNAYTQLQAWSEQGRIFERSLELARKTERIAQAKLAIGQGTQLDLDQTTLDRETVELKLTQVPAQQRLEALETAQIAGLKPGAVLEVCSLTGVPDAGETLQLEAATQIQIRAQKVVVDRLSVAAAVSEFFPTLNAVGGVTWSGAGADDEELRDSFTFDNWYVGGTLSWTLFDGFGRYYGDRAARRELIKSKRDLENERRSLEISDQKSARQLNDLAAQRTLLERSVVLARKQADVMLKRYEAGTATYDMVHLSHQQLEAQQLQLVTLIEQQWQLAVVRAIRAGRTHEIIQQVVKGRDPQRCVEVHAVAEEVQ